MPDLLSLPVLGVLVLFCGLAGGWLLVRASGAHLRLGRRLAGAAQVRVGDIADLDPLPSRPVRVAGRIRCADPILTDRDERLVALHRDVEVRLGDGSWRTIERIRESRGFDLWDHDGSQAIDPGRGAEPLVAIPHVWRGEASELLEEGYRAAVERLEREGRRPSAARSVTRMISTVDRLLVLAIPVRDDDGQVRLEPPSGGFVISSLELPDAMRLLGGRRRAWMLGGVALMGLAVVIGVALILAGLLVG